MYLVVFHGDELKQLFMFSGNNHIISKWLFTAKVLDDLLLSIFGIHSLTLINQEALKMDTNNKVCETWQ